MNRPPINGIEVFLTIIRTGSLRAAARSLGVGAPAISHQLKALEKKIGVKLLVRTTRSIELTDAGRTLLAGSAPAYEAMVNSIEEAREIGKSTSGTLRITLSRSAYLVAIAPVLADFQTVYPDVCLDLSISEGLADIVEEGFHAGIRVGDRISVDMIATRLTGPLRPAYSASPAYLSVHGRPEHPEDLLLHKCIRYKFISANRIADWNFMEDGQMKTIDPPSRLIFDSFQLVNQATLDGHGIGWSLRAPIETYLAQGALETILDTYVTELPPFYIFYPQQNRRIEPLRLFVDYLIARRNAAEEPDAT